MVKKPVIYITRKIPKEIIQPYDHLLDIHMWESADRPVPKEILMRATERADGILTVLSDQVDRELMDQSQHLKVISNMAVGYDNIDIAYAKEKGITITNTPDVLTETTADLAFSLLMATARRIVEATNFIKTNNWVNWAPYLLAGSDVHGKTIGIVGMGRIGEAIARRAKGFNMKISYHNRNRKLQAEQEIGAVYKSFDALISESDYIVSVVPLTKETNRLFNAAAFEKMKTSAIFINISRGHVVDEEALVKALQSKQIKAAGLDVFEEEPIQNDHPLLAFENVICLPHIGSATEETRTRMLHLCLENLSHVLQNKEALTPVK